MDYVEGLWEAAELRRLEAGAANDGSTGGPLTQIVDQMAAIDASANIAADVTCPPLIGQLFGGAPGADMRFSNVVPVGYRRGEDGGVEISFDSGGQTVIVPGQSDAHGIMEARLATEAGLFSIGGVVAEGPNRLHGSGRAFFAFEGERCDIDWHVPG